ncbi:MAG TPA: hypothetical protein VFT10_04825, partial [Solirubrobacterales bacterium]|nr:hypothetical protein [Solirubrobacterales bacterium]
MASAGDMVKQATASIATAGCEAPEADAKALVAKALEMSVEELELDGTTTISPQLREEIERLVSRRQEREPLEYIV